MSSKLTSADILLCIIIIVMAIAPAFALGSGNRNLLLIGVMGVAPIVLLRYPRLYLKEIILLLFIVAIILCPLILHPRTMRWSTVLYSAMFCFTFMAYNRLLNNGVFTITHYCTLLQYLIYAYVIVLIIQQFCVLVSLPIFNLGNYNPHEPWKLNSLSAEPSHTARIVALLMYSYLTAKENIINRKYCLGSDFRKDKWVWIAFLWTMVTMGSGTAFIFILFVLLKLIRIKTFIPVFVILCCIVFLAEIMEIKAIDRAYKTTLATLTLDEKAIMKADGSAAARIVPAIVLIKKVSITDINGWLGHGVDQLSEKRLIDFSSIGYGKKGVTGTLFTVWFEYGFIAFSLFLIFSLSVCFRKGDILSVLFWFMLVFLYGINNQIVWLCIILLHLNKQIIKPINNQIR